MLENIHTVVLLIVTIGMPVLLFISQSQMAHMRKRITQQATQIDTLKNNMQGLFAGAVGSDSRLHKLETRTRRTMERQEVLENSKHAERPYEQAIRMVQQGSKVEDLMAVCNLSRGEADLIMMVHGTQEQDAEQSGQYH